MAPRAQQTPQPGGSDSSSDVCWRICKFLQGNPDPNIFTVCTQRCLFQLQNGQDPMTDLADTTATGAAYSSKFAQASLSTKSSAYNQMAAATPLTTSSTPSSPYTSPLSTSTSGTSSSPPPPPPSNQATQTPNKDWHPRPGHNGPTPYVIAAGVIVPLVIIAFIIGAVITVYRTRRRRKSQAATMAKHHHPEMQDLSSRRPSENAYIRPPSSAPPPSLTTTNPSTPRSAGPPQPPPVLLSSTMDGAYFTGLDTADHISLRSEPGATSAPADPFLGDDEEEPPPPYRPRSVPPISRETSVRTSIIERNGSGRSRVLRASVLTCGGGIDEMDGLSNPFEDPDDEEDGVFADEAGASASGAAVNPASTADSRSEASELSYQQEPVQGRSPL